MVDEVVLISAPRSGTNYLCDTMGTFPGAVNLFEIFNPRGVFGLQRHEDIRGELSKYIGLNISDEGSPELIKYVSDHRLEFLDLLVLACQNLEKNILIYKIFPDQISDDELSSIIASKKNAFLLLARKRIDTFISLKKAMDTDTWMNKNTSDMKVSIDYDDFMSWGKMIDAWYADAERKIRASGKVHTLLSYDADVNMPKALLVEKIYLTLRSMGIELTYPETIEASNFRRQDVEIAPFKKISNGEALRNRLLQERLLGRYALRTPFITPR